MLGGDGGDGASETARTEWHQQGRWNDAWIIEQSVLETGLSGGGGDALVQVYLSQQASPSKISSNL